MDSQRIDKFFSSNYSLVQKTSKWINICFYIVKSLPELLADGAKKFSIVIHGPEDAVSVGSGKMERRPG